MSAIHVVVRPSQASTNPHTPIQTLLDLVVDGVNITARSGQGPALALLCDLSHVVAALGRGRRHRATLDLHADALPWRLGVETDGEDTLLTVFRGGACPEVAVFERRVKTIDLRRALVEALAEASATRSSDTSSFAAAAAALKHPWPSYLGLPVPKRLCKVAPKRSRGFGFGVEAEFRQRPQPIEEADKSARLEQADLHSLLLEGRFKVTSKTRKVSLASVQPFLLTERVVALAEDVMDAWQMERALFRRVEIDGVRLGVRRGAGDGPLTLTVNARANTPEGKTFSFA
ncbi:MAG TPA: hypothetical protein VFU02_14935, partial [Polyangiaceae bacterium]|nr:hypothetical protein [Polyangiaceae bacterium]